MKYVAFKRPHGGVTQFLHVVFPNHLVHKDVADALLAGPMAGFEVHGAGEVSSLTFTVDFPLHGSSESLGVGTDPDETSRLKMCDYGGNFE